VLLIENTWALGSITAVVLLSSARANPRTADQGARARAAAGGRSALGGARLARRARLLGGAAEDEQPAARHARGRRALPRRRQDAAAAAAAAAASAAETSAFFRSRSTAAQHHALALLGRILHVDPTAIHAMRGAALWELAYGPAFFFFGQVITKRWPGPIRVRASNLQMNLQFKDLLVVCCMWTHRTRSMAYRKGMFTGRRM